MKKLIALSVFAFALAAQAQTETYWQQHVDYQMEIDVDARDYQYEGAQKLVYTNNSPDTLQQVFYHLHFNAFQPGSDMDMRLQNIADPDGRMVTKENGETNSRIASLNDDEIGYIRVNSLTQNGEKLTHKTVGTVLQVQLDQPILPGQKTTFEMDFEAQIPVQIRRSGRNNAEGVALSMTQWYPKLAEYDDEGWHADQYIGREFHGVWGDFDVKITIDKDYILGGTGYLQNPNEIGYGYEDEGTKVKRRGKKLTWHFKAPKVHDFTWAADKEFIHDKRTAADGTVLHFLYKDEPQYADNPYFMGNWKKLQEKTEGLLLFYNEHIGPYPWDQYSVIQGGDGGMEYAMCTLITGNRSFGSLVGVTAHEMAHAWFQHLLATNESQHEWMDEGFTTYISGLAMNEVMNEGKSVDEILTNSYRGYNYMANTGAEQPQTTHADRYHTNQNYGITAYSKGSVFLSQLGYIIGEENLAETLNRYYAEWKFKHPSPSDFIRVAEKVSEAQLRWYLNDWTRTTNTIDYAIKAVEADDENTNIILERKGLMPMPVEVAVTYTNGETKQFYIPLQMMYWEKPNAGEKAGVWSWANPTHSLSLLTKKDNIQKIEIDPSLLMADVDRTNNTYKKD